MLMGQSNSGKSYLASQAVKSVQKIGGNAFWIDNEISWDSDWMLRCGVDTNNIHIAQPTTGESCFEIMTDIMQTGLADLIVLDSIAGLVPANVVEQQGDFGYSPMAYQARFINQSLPRMMPYLKHGTAVIVINQTRESIGASAVLNNLPGGRGQTFYSHIILRLRRDGWITEGANNIRVGFDVEIRNEKTKAGGYSQRSTIIPFRFEGGIDVVETEIRELIANGMIAKSGAWYKLPNGERIQGMNGLKAYFITNNEELAILMGEAGHIFNDEDEEAHEHFEDWILPEDEEMLKNEEEAAYPNA